MVYGQSYNIAITGTGFITQAMSTATGCPVSTVKVSTPGSFLSSPSVPVTATAVASTTQITATVVPNGPPNLATHSDAYYGAEGVTVEVTNFPPPPTFALTAAAGFTASAPADLVGTTAIQWMSDPNGSSPIISGTTQQAVVGQQIVLAGTPTAAVLEDLPLSIDVPSPPTWTVAGTNIGGYNPSTASASVTETTLTGTTLTTYWVYPGTFEVTYTSCMQSKTATPALYDCPTTAATFVVTGGGGIMASTPFSLLTISQLIPCVNGLPPANGGNTAPYLLYGLLTGYDCQLSLTGAFGMTFMPPGAPSAGIYSYVQLLNSDSRTENAISCTHSQGVDLSYPYSAIVGDNLAVDAPFVPLPSGYIVNRTFNATMFLLWTPSGTNSIPVPIGYQTWGFTGEAQEEGETWVASTNETPPPGPLGGFETSSDVTNPGPPALDHGFPIWSGPSLETCN